MALATFDLDAGAFGRAAGLLEAEPVRVERDLRRLTQRAASRAVKALERATPVGQRQPGEPDRPHMRDLWHQETTGPSESIVFNEAPYSGFLFSGTQSHWVAPVQAQALRFFEGGTAVFSRGHEVSGITPNPKLLAALDDQVGKAQGDLFDYGVAETLRLARQIDITAA